MYRVPQRSCCLLLPACRLWESAQTTAHSLPARLAVEHCVHEARGLDVLPSTVQKFRGNGDAESAALLEDVIYAVRVAWQWGGGHLGGKMGTSRYHAFWQGPRLGRQGGLDKGRTEAVASQWEHVSPAACTASAGAGAVAHASCLNLTSNPDMFTRSVHLFNSKCHKELERLISTEAACMD